MGAAQNLIGRVFGRLTVVGKSSKRDQGNICWICICSCGNTEQRIIQTARLNAGKANSCGCLTDLARQQVGRANCTKRHIHGLATPGDVDRYYNKWHNIKGRCFNTKDPGYKNYGGRGITLWSNWINDPAAFVKYIKALPGSNDPALSLDRFPNNDGNYEPGNLRWATPLQQTHNSRTCLRKNKI